MAKTISSSATQPRPNIVKEVLDELLARKADGLKVPAKSLAYVKANEAELQQSYAALGTVDKVADMVIFMYQ